MRFCGFLMCGGDGVHRLGVHCDWGNAVMVRGCEFVKFRGGRGTIGGGNGSMCSGTCVFIMLLDELVSRSRTCIVSGGGDC